MDQPKPICDLCEEKEAVCVMKPSEWKQNEGLLGLL